MTPEELVVDKFRRLLVENARLRRQLQILGDGCHVRKVHEEWPALKPLIIRAMDICPRWKDLPIKCEAFAGYKNTLCKNRAVWKYRLTKLGEVTYLEHLCGTHFHVRSRDGWQLEHTGDKLA